MSCLILVKLSGTNSDNGWGYLETGNKGNFNQQLNNGLTLGYGMENKCDLDILDMSNI